MSKHQVRNTFLPPTAIKLLRETIDPAKIETTIRSIATGGETLGAELIEWGRAAFGITMNEFWGQTETNLLCGNCGVIHDVRPGSLGRSMPGHQVEVLDDDGNILPPGELGVLAAKGPDPVFLLEYWRNPEATEGRYNGEWWITGDLAHKDEDGFIWFAGRDDDVISSGATGSGLVKSRTASSNTRLSPLQLLLARRIPCAAKYPRRLSGSNQVKPARTNLPKTSSPLSRPDWRLTSIRARSSSSRSFQ